MDLELAEWREEWQSDALIPPDLNDALRRKVERQSRWMRIMRWSEIFVTVVFGGGTAIWALRSGHVSVFVLAALTWVSIAMAWTFSLMNTRGLWSPAAESNSEFLDLTIRRCRRQIEALPFTVIVFVFNVTFTLIWVYRVQTAIPLGEFLRSGNVCVVWAVTLIFFGLLAWYRRRKHAELAQLLNLRSMLN